MNTEVLNNISERSIMYHFPGRTRETVAEYINKLDLTRNKIYSNDKNPKQQSSQKLELKDEGIFIKNNVKKDEILKDETFEDPILIKIDISSVIELD